MKFRFTCESSGLDYHVTSVEFTAELLPLVLSNFADFLRGCGYVIDYDRDLILTESATEQTKQSEM